MSDAVAENVTHSPAPADIARDLEGLIVDGVLASDQRLTEREVTERYHCSYSMAREVLHFLEWFGVVRLSSRRGARVVGTTEFQPDQVMAVWFRLYSLMLDEIRRRHGDIPIYGAAQPEPHRMFARFAAVKARLEMLGKISGNRRLSELLSLAAIQIAIVAPGRFGQIESSLTA